MEGGDEELRGVQTLSWCWREQEEDEEGEEERDGGEEKRSVLVHVCFYHYAN